MVFLTRRCQRWRPANPLLFGAPLKEISGNHGKSHNSMALRRELRKMPYLFRRPCTLPDTWK